MADDAQTWTGLSLEARHVPEEHDPNRPYPHDTDNPVTGFVDIGTEIDGVFVVLLRRKAPGLFADIDRARESQQREQQSEQQPATPSE